MSAALIPSAEVPIARTDADYAFDIRVRDQDWTGDDVRVAFTLQGRVPETFEINVTPTSDVAVPIRILAADLHDVTPGIWTAEVRRFSNGVKAVAEFRWQLFRGVSAFAQVGIAGRPPVGAGRANSGVIITGSDTVVLVPYVSVEGLSAAQTAFNDALTMLGVDNVQDAIVALYALIGSGPIDPPDPDSAPGVLDFTIPENSALIGAL